MQYQDALDLFWEQLDSGDTATSFRPYCHLSGFSLLKCDYLKMNPFICLADKNNSDKQNLVPSQLLPDS